MEVCLKIWYFQAVQKKQVLNGRHKPKAAVQQTHIPSPIPIHSFRCSPTPFRFLRHTCFACFLSIHIVIKWGRAERGAIDLVSPNQCATNAVCVTSSSAIFLRFLGSTALLFTQNVGLGLGEELLESTWIICPHDDFQTCDIIVGRRLNGFLGLSLNDRTILFLILLLDKTVLVGWDCIWTLVL